MALEIAVGPQKLVINQGVGFLVTEQDGQVDWPTDKGLYYSDTRLISSWRLYADGEPWDLLNSGNITYNAARIFLTNRRLVTETGEVPAATLGLSIGRSLDGGLHEDLDLVNNGMTTAQFNLELALRSDFADLFEVKSKAIVRRGRVTSAWSKRHLTLTTDYENQDFRRTVSVRVRHAGSRPVYANGRISFDVELKPGERWHACLLYEFSDGKAVQHAPKPCIDECLNSPLARRLAEWRKRGLSLSTSNEEFYRFFSQSMEDMAGLRLPIEGTDHMAFVPAAGIPWFVGLFGRDSLIVSLQNVMVYPDFAKGSLEVLGRYQARKRDDYRDAEPGKIMHELRTGELAHFKMIPHTPYYGTADATLLYLIVLHAAWRSTGEADLLKRHMATAERCLAWIDKYGDRDGDGFQEYQTRSSAGYENQGWKDSGEALVYPDGSLVKGPKALVELQGYVYDAWRRMAEIFDALGKTERAADLRAKAAALFKRFNAAFWDEKSGFYAFCLDGEKKPVLSIASNPGHLLWSGIVPRDRAARVAKRLMAPDMWSGWGIRTLSAEHPAYNPRSYQNGSVWPHDNGIIAMGCRRYGLATEAKLIARDVSAAAGYFVQHRMPELYAGLQRDPTNFPVQYLGANVPQAWAAGSCFSFVHAMTGFQPDAPEDMLYLDPDLPDWMPDLLLQNLRVGKRAFDIRFRRDGETTGWEVVRGDKRRVAHRDVAVFEGDFRRRGLRGHGRGRMTIDPAAPAPEQPGRKPVIPYQVVLEGQPALVTGANSGIGRAVALGLAHAGADVAVNYVTDPDAAQAVVAEIVALGRRAIAVKADVSREDEVAAMFAQAVGAFGTLHIVVANAGLQRDAPFEQMTLAQWNSVIGVNLTGQFLCAREAVREFNRRGLDPAVSAATGKLICMSSVHEKIAWAGHANYAASKGGVSMLMKSLAQEVAPRRIRVNSIAPGAVRTPINTAAWDTPQAYAELMTLVPYKRIGEPDDIARAAVWLASDAADYVTGATLFVDGGMTLYPGFSTGG